MRSPNMRIFRLSLVMLSVYSPIVHSQTLLGFPKRHKDIDKEGLVGIVRRYTDELKTLREKVEDLQCRTSSTDIYFHAWKYATVDNIPGGTTIVYDRVITNKGNGYNRITGKFTAPRGGAFVFTWTAVTTDYHSINLHLYVNGKRIGVAQADSLTGSQNSSGSNTAVVELKEGDIVRVVCGVWGGTSKHRLHGDAHSSFSGWAL
ncbi:hypothetical protein FSP39_007145 [Pinctada imbricata]|uniref:C1q domain-containing protein n=1 Tax=Pinctada imbricata TaxID=66713 RepID=A0AA88XHH5_PINIB|nr:hypothetical protein FSP39_007145 [Pinctada imbricata]